MIQIVVITQEFLNNWLQKEEEDEELYVLETLQLK
jgi:hypothetical protein